MTGGLIGAGGGAALATALGASWLPGAIVGGLLLGVVTAWADATRIPGRTQPILVRLLGTVFLVAGVGGILDWALPSWPSWIPCLLTGVIVSLFGFRPAKVLLGATIGLVVGLLHTMATPEIGWAAPMALIALVYRALSAWIWRGRDQVRIMGEGMDATDARYVVPFAEVSRHVGVDYLRRYAERTGVSFVGRAPDVGILQSLDDLGGPEFDPARVHPLIREFYEHTGRFRLSIVPEWKTWMRIPYRIYRGTVARPLGQANAPFEIEEVQRGVTSWIDTIDLDEDGAPDVRAWVRAYDDGEPLYVGIYTVQRIEDAAYVAVGFPLPSGSFTATLAPSNHRGDGLLLSSAADDAYAGHYLSYIDEDDRLTTLQLAAFGEEIEVFVTDGVLLTEHRFSLGGLGFMTLHYTIESKHHSH